MFADARVIVVVPAYDEAPRIGAVLSTMPAFVDGIVVVDDASRDDTAAVARACGRPGVEVIRHANNRGVGAAIATGYARAMELAASDRDVFVVMAGDGQMDPDDMPRLIAPVVDGDAGYVKGDRFRDPDVRRVMPRARRLGGEVMSRLTSLAIGQRVRDSQCGYTALARWACARLDLAGLWPRYGYPNDLLGQLALRDVEVVEVPVRPVYGPPSKLRLRHLAAIAAVVARAAWRVRVRRDRSRDRR